ncbi:rCG63257 [Rattus norvegicus]|uniref:RCG63257 n=1 Tax=Rattus norvegicus TaxID=10116 RepID=A6JHC6_RAT|nr:rCG63257 [Rattus norvegicus]
MRLGTEDKSTKYICRYALLYVRCTYGTDRIKFYKLSNIKHIKIKEDNVFLWTSIFQLLDWGFYLHFFT